MVNKIWKFTFNIDSNVRIDMPGGAKILSVQLQNGQPTMWALCDVNTKVVQRVFRIFGPGQPVANVGSLKFIETFQPGAYVWRMFEVV